MAWNAQPPVTRPADGQALLTRATVLSVQGRHAQARRDCQGIARLTSALVTAACDAAPASLSGQAENAYASLTIALEREPNAPASVREWALTLLAEIAARRGDSMAAETNFSAALVLDPRDPYLLGAYSDFFLDRDRPEEAIRLLRDFTRNDSLLLRLALAEARVPALRRPFQTHRADLAARFDAARRRGDAVHRREEARYTLHIIHDAPAALALAQDNWRTQKEPADLRILLEAGAAANDSATLRDATAWIAVHHFEDVALAPALRRRG